MTTATTATNTERSTRFIHVRITDTLTKQIAGAIYRSTNIPLSFGSLSPDTRRIYLKYANDVVERLLELTALEVDATESVATLQENPQA